MTWTYGPAGWIEDLNTWIKDPTKTNPKYDWEDVQPGLRASGMERRARRHAWIGRRQAMVHTLGLRAQLDRVQPEDVRQGRSEACEQSSRTHRDHRQAHQGFGWTVRDRRPRLSFMGDNSSGFLSGYSNYGQRTLPSPTVQIEGRDRTRQRRRLIRAVWIQMIDGAKNWWSVHPERQARSRT